MAGMFKPRGGVVAVLDVGSAKVVCLVAKGRQDGTIEISGVGHKQADGFKSGQVTNAKQLVKCMMAAIDDAEQTSGEDISSVYVTLSGFNLRSHYCGVETVVNGHEISDRDIKILTNKCRDLYSDSNGSVVVHTIPLSYKLDDNEDIVDPRGMYGNVLSAFFHIITASKSALTNISHCIHRCHVSIAGYIDGSYAAGFSCLEGDEKKLGVTLVDIGGGCTSIGIFTNDNLVYSDVVPMGGMHITKDIASGLSTTIANAEKIKVLHGSVLVTAMDRNEPIEVSCISSAGDSADEVAHVTKEALVDIIRPRVEEILELTIEKLRAVSSRFICMHRIIFTGGSSKLNGLRDLAKHMYPDTKARTRSTVTGVESSIIDISDQSFAAAIGAVISVRGKLFSDTNVDGDRPSRIRRAVHWLKEMLDT
jgi:cell division protein FtsA